MSIDHRATQPKQQKKLKVYQEDAKLRQTTHWDLDYMTTAEIEALYKSARQHSQRERVTEDGEKFSGQKRSQYKKIGLAVALLASSGVVILSLLVASGGI